MQPYRVTVFCSANPHIDAQFFTEATHFSQELAKRGWELIFGGSQLGLMGHFADVALENGARVRGAITEALAAGPECAHLGLTELVIVKDLFDRKRWMMERGDGFAIFPGGLGTLDEALEVITWKALGYFDKPIVFVNVDGFWQSQIKAFQDFDQRGMIRAGGLGLFDVVDSGQEALEIFAVGASNHAKRTSAPS